jgi:hypothetical protein
MANPSTDKNFPDNDADLGGDYARDTHRGAYGDDYAREGEVGSAARGDLYGSADPKAEPELDHEHELGKASE